MGLQVFKRLPLRPVVGVVLEIAEPVVLILPIDIFDGFHGQYCSRTLKVWETERGNGYSIRIQTGSPKTD